MRALIDEFAIERASTGPQNSHSVVLSWKGSGLPTLEDSDWHEDCILVSLLGTSSFVIAHPLLHSVVGNVLCSLNSSTYVILSVPGRPTCIVLQRRRAS